MGLDTDRPAPGRSLDRSNSVPLVEMRGITKTFGSVTAVAGADFDLHSGEIHALLGENGAGKTTLMNLLYGLEQPDDGTILIDGGPVSLRSAHDAIQAGIGMVHQHFQLVPRLSVAENVILGAGEGRRIRLPDLAGVAKTVEGLGERYGLPVSATSLVADLSVGEQQRVEILRALYRGARILILDEPTATLSPVEIDHLIEQLQGMAGTGTAIVMITHHLDEVMTAALAKEATAAQAEQGADVFVACGNAGSFGMIQETRERGLSSFGYVYDESSLAPDNVVASMAWQIGETYRQMVNDIAADNFQPFYDVLMSDGGFEVQMNPDYSAGTVSAEAMELFETRLQEVIDGTFEVPFIASAEG